MMSTNDDIFMLVNSMLTVILASIWTNIHNSFTKNEHFYTKTTVAEKNKEDSRTLYSFLYQILRKLNIAIPGSK